MHALFVLCKKAPVILPHPLSLSLSLHIMARIVVVALALLVAAHVNAYTNTCYDAVQQV